MPLMETLGDGGVFPYPVRIDAGEPGALSVDWQVVNVSPESTGLRRAVVYHGAGFAGVLTCCAAAIFGKTAIAATGNGARRKWTSKHNNRMVLLLIAGIPVTMILAQPGFGISWCSGDLDLVGSWVPLTVAPWCSRPGRSTRRPAGRRMARLYLRRWSRAGLWSFPRRGAL